MDQTYSHIISYRECVGVGIYKRVSFTICFTLEHITIVGSTFLQDVDHDKATKMACIEIYRGGSKRPCQQFSDSSILSKNRYPPSKGQHQLQPIRSV